jgi:hypothetical protein
MYSRADLGGLRTGTRAQLLERKPVFIEAPHDYNVSDIQVGQEADLTA